MSPQQHAPPLYSIYTSAIQLAPKAGCADFLPCSVVNFLLAMQQRPGDDGAMLVSFLTSISLISLGWKFIFP
jgi:hypothetical protein